MDNINYIKATEKEMQEIDRCTLEISHLIAEHTVQLLVKGGKYAQYGYSPLGSGVLAFIGNKCFILTAAHVTEEISENHLYFLIDNDFIPVQGVLCETDAEKDKIDMAYIMLDDEIAYRMAHYHTFLPRNKIKTAHARDFRDNYLVLGYPATNVFVNKNDKKITLGSSSFLIKEADEKVYKHYKFEKNKHYVLEFSGKGTSLKNGERIKNPELWGISGCGLWFIEYEILDNVCQATYSLVGIMTEFKKGTFFCLIGNQIDIILAKIYQDI